MRPDTERIAESVGQPLLHASALNDDAFFFEWILEWGSELLREGCEQGVGILAPKNSHASWGSLADCCRPVIDNPRDRTSSPSRDEDVAVLGAGPHLGKQTQDAPQAAVRTDSEGGWNQGARTGW